MKSAQTALSVLGEYKPKVAVLGNLNRSVIEEYKIGEEFYTKPLKIYKDEQDLLAKEKLTIFLHQEMHLNTLFYVLPIDSIVVRTVKNQ